MSEEHQPKYSQLTLSERQQIEFWIGHSRSYRQMGAALGRYHSSIRREIKRHGGLENYSADVAHLRARKLKVRLKRRIRNIKMDKKDE